ncbi:MAG: WG repeat-containing protein, partial [Pseudanabaena sp. SU_2_4]|nr:WG repeat-containing protein [Pseudanabaena sp. SU_2_4]
MKRSISAVLCLALLGLTAGCLRLSPIQAAESSLQLTQVLETIQQQQRLTRLFPIYENGKIGFIDRTGRITIEPRFDEIFVGFSEGLAPVRIGIKWGYIDRTGKIAIEPRFDRGFDFSEGLAAVAINRRLGYINKTGKIVIPVEFE